MSTETAETEAPVAVYPRWTVDLLRKIPHIEGERYELINGELYVTTAPHIHHQIACTRLATALTLWSQQSDLGGAAAGGPGVIYADDEAVIPDLVWLSAERLAALTQKDGKLHGSPELVVEFLSPGKINEARDREVKLELYSRRGVQEYWIADWRAIAVEVYRPVDGVLQLAQTLRSGETLTSPLLPGFAVVIDSFLKL